MFVTQNVFFMSVVLEVIVRFLNQVTQFSVIQNVSVYHFIKRPMEVYHHVECDFMGKCVQIQCKGPGVKVKEAPSPHPSILSGRRVWAPLVQITDDGS